MLPFFDPPAVAVPQKRTIATPKLHRRLIKSFKAIVMPGPFNFIANVTKVYDTRVFIILSIELFYCVSKR